MAGHFSLKISQTDSSREMSLLWQGIPNEDITNIWSTFLAFWPAGETGLPGPQTSANDQTSETFGIMASLSKFEVFRTGIEAYYSPRIGDWYYETLRTTLKELCIEFPKDTRELLPFVVRLWIVYICAYSYRINRAKAHSIESL